MDFEQQPNYEANQIWGIQGKGQPSSNSNRDRRNRQLSGFFRVKPFGSGGETGTRGIPVSSRQNDVAVLKKILSQLLIEHRTQIAMKLAEVERLEASASEYEQMIADIDTATDSVSQKQHQDFINT